VRSTPIIAKLIDTSTCIGCKACEVACQEWNDLPPETTVQMGTYQTLPTMTANFWNLIRFNEHEEDGTLHWLMRKDQCMHCADPGCLAACPAPGAVIQYANGIVDFNQDQCIGCGLCMSGCPFDVPKFAPKTRRVYKCTLCVDRTSVGLQPACIKACPTSCLQFGTKDAMLEIANRRVDQLKANGYTNAAVYDPPGVGGTSVVTVLALGDRPELYGLPKNPSVPAGVGLFKGVLRRVGGVAMLAGVFVAAIHHLRYGRKHPDAQQESGERS
jgi:formate dehydrogenase iron-sulfur subunit